MDSKSLIVIVTYNSQDFIEKCLLSIAGQSYENWFLVIVDNASSDGTIFKIREFRDTHPGIDSGNFKLICLKKNIGFAGAVNYAVFNFMIEKEKDTGMHPGYLVLLNPDVYLKESSLERMISFLDKAGYSGFSKKNIGAAGGLILDYEKNMIIHMGGKVSDNFITSHIIYGKDYHSLKKDLENGMVKSGNISLINGVLNVDYATGAFFVTEFKLFKDMGGFDRGYRPAYFEELDYCIKIRKTGRRVVVNPESVAMHFEGASVKKFSRNFYKFYHKNRIRCALINLGFLDFLRVFIKTEIRWIRNSATGDQHAPLFYAYFLNFVFLPYNLIIKIKNHLILNKIELK
jgi:O-antigen biosynthesis protein